MCQVDLQAIIGSYTAVATGLESESARVSSLDGDSLLPFNYRRVNSIDQKR